MESIGVRDIIQLSESYAPILTNFHCVWSGAIAPCQYKTDLWVKVPCSPTSEKQNFAWNEEYSFQLFVVVSNKWTV